MKNSMPSEFIGREYGRHPPSLTPSYKSTVLRAPRLPRVSLPTPYAESHGPVFGASDLTPLDNDLIRNHATSGDAIGERTILHGRVLDESGRPVPHTLIEIWQANAGGRYRHVTDNYVAALDPNFGGGGRALTDRDGRYAFRTIKPGAYPYPNHTNSWRPAHVHFSLFGTGFAQRLVTQMYFEGDPLIPDDDILNTIPDPAARQALIARLDRGAARPLDSLAYRFDIVLRGRRQTFFEEDHDHA